MLRSRLKNIISKSNGFKQQTVGNPFDEFKKSLPMEVDDNYRLEAAWKAYGSPKDYKEALWNGLIQPIDETNVKLPSIGYNSETDEYEYLNKGRENETVDKDIRVWDNDVIPLVKELKLGGYLRVYNEEKDCWTYSKNKPQESLPNLGEVNSFKQGGQMNILPEGALHARKNNMDLAKEGEITHKGIPVVDNEGNLLAEVEKEEWTVTKSLTEDIEKWCKKYFDENTSQKEKDELAIKCGKRICKELLHNTEDRAGLINKVEEES